MTMDTQQQQYVRQWIAGWKEAGQRMEQLRRAELPYVKTSEALRELADAYESCRLHFSPTSYSGLIEQQAWFSKYRTGNTP